jgi:hypothetical protein
MTIRTQIRGQSTRRVWTLLAPWLALYVFLAWGWRVRDIFGSIPSFGDVLEVLWGIAWYRDALIVKHVSPLYTPLVFHPNGWQTATLAHTPAFFLAALPLYEFGGAAFAYNSLAILGLAAAFAGAFRFVRLFATGFEATSAALFFTFVGMHWMRAGGGHLNVLWSSSLLPWLAWGLERLRRTESVSQSVLAAGLAWA